MIVRRVTVTREWVKGIGLATDHITFSDAATKGTARARSAADSVAFSDHAGPFDPAFDSVAISDSARVSASGLRTSDSVAISDQAKTGVANRSADSITFGDSA